MSKFYAIETREGKRIFSTWDECLEFRDRYPSNARYKKFSTENEARAFLGLDAPTPEATKTTKPAKTPKANKKLNVMGEQPIKNGGKNTKNKVINKDPNIRAMYEAAKPTEVAIAYVDGSFNNKSRKYGYGVVLLDLKKPEEQWIYTGSNNKYSGSRNISGEVDGAVRAVKEAIKKGFKTIIIHYDYAGIEMWATGEWKRNNDMTRKYYQTMRSLGGQIDIQFKKVTAHTGVELNEEADRLAKYAVGLY